MLKKGFYCIVFLFIMIIAGSAFANAEIYYTGDKIANYKKGDFAIINAKTVDFKLLPSNESVTVAKLPRNYLVRLLKDNNVDWQKIEWNGQEGYIRKEHIKFSLPEELTEEDNLLGELSLGNVFENNSTLELGNLIKEGKKGKIYSFVYEQNFIAVNNSKKDIFELATTSPTVYTMRGVGVDDKANKIIGQYGMPAWIKYNLENGKLLSATYGYKFSEENDECESLLFVFDQELLLKQIILQG